MTVSQPPAVPVRVPLVEDAVEIFLSPGEVFRRRIGGNVWLPLAVILVLAGVLHFATKGLLQPVFDAEWARQVAKMSVKLPEAASQMGAGRGMAGVVGAIARLVGIPIDMALTGIALWFLGKIFGSSATLSDTILVAVYAWIPRLLSLVASGIIMLTMDVAKVNSLFSATLSVAKFLDPDTTAPVMFVLAGRMDVFIVWQTILLAIGLSVAGKLPRAKAFAAAALVWFLGTAPALIGAVLQ